MGGAVIFNSRSTSACSRPNPSSLHCCVAARSLAAVGISAALPARMNVYEKDGVCQTEGKTYLSMSAQRKPLLVD